MTAQFSPMLASCALVLAATVAHADVGPSPTLDADGGMLANVSISVSDLEKSGRFYKALGFEAGDIHAVPAVVAKLLGAKGADAKLEIRYMKRDGLVMELVHVTPTPAVKASEGSAAQFGLAHIAFRVDSVERFSKLVKENGGRTLDDTHTHLGPMEIVFASDPDGTLIEVAGPAPKS